jgi:phosphoribosylformylglycinamidine synthase
LVRGTPPALDLGAERALQGLLVSLASARAIRSAHDCSDGGLAVALAECCFGSGAGADVSIDAVAVSSDARVNEAAALFGESASRVLLAVAPDRVAPVLERARAAGVPARVVGRTGGPRLRMAIGGRVVVDASVEEAERVWDSVIERRFARKVA